MYLVEKFGIACMEIVGLGLIPALIFKRKTYLKYDILVLVKESILKQMETKPFVQETKDDH